MKLLTKELMAKLPPLYSQDELGDKAIVHVKFFSPISNWTWYATEYCPNERKFFGLVIGHEAELGFFLLDDLEGIKLPLGLKIERDLYFEPKSLREIKQKYGLNSTSY